MTRSIPSSLAVAVLVIAGTNAFVTPSKMTTLSSQTALHFGIPTFQPKKDDGEDKKDGSEKKMDLKGLAQLVTAGMGAPFLGDFQGVDKDTGKFMFSLEANNLVDEEGNSKQTSAPYFESGWVDPADLEKEKQRKENGFKFPWQK